jgi:hypothetical protein
MLPTKQQRLKKFIRQPERLQPRQLTDKGLEGVAIIERYRFVPSSLLVRLMLGGQRNNYRNLQTLFHKNLVSRFALPKYGGPGEFIYYLDGRQALDTLITEGLLTVTDNERKAKEEIIRSNRERNYAQLHRNPDVQGQVLFIQHELMVSRFHAMLELACRKLAGKAELVQWVQGPQLWNRVEVPKVIMKDGIPAELAELQALAHRPDAFFTLRFPRKPEGQQLSNFFYEADRKTENTTRFKLKLRAHYHFIVRKNLQRALAPYNVHAIRAVLTESIEIHWAQTLRETAGHPIVSQKPSPLFWFTSSEIFTRRMANGQRTQPLYLDQPEWIFKRIWASPVDDTLLNLAD